MAFTRGFMVKLSGQNLCWEFCYLERCMFFGGNGEGLKWGRNRNVRRTKGELLSYNNINNNVKKIFNK